MSLELFLLSALLCLDLHHKSIVFDPSVIAMYKINENMMWPYMTRYSREAKRLGKLLYIKLYSR